MTNSYDQLNRLVQTVEPFITGSTPRTLTTRTQYDAVGNRTASISARAFDAAGGSGSYTRFVTSYRYNALNRLVRTDLPVDLRRDRQPGLDGPPRHEFGPEPGAGEQEDGHDLLGPGLDSHQQGPG
jgi:hypothetical protein